MKMYRLYHLLQALLISSFAIFIFSFSHLSFNQSSMTGMKDMSGHSDSPVHCQMLCTTSLKADMQGILLYVENDATAPLFDISVLAEISLSLLTVSFVVKLLHLLSSWRPPDRILLYGHYADGL